MVLSPENCLRKACSSIVKSQNFETFIIAAILGNSVILALTDYKDTEEKTIWNKNLNFLGDIFTWLFTIESLLKILSSGLIFHEKSYLRDIGNMIDFIIVIAGLIEFTSTQLDLD